MHHENAAAISPEATNAASRVSRPKRNEKSADDLHPATTHQRRKRFAFRVKVPNILIEAMAGKHQADD